MRTPIFLNAMSRLHFSDGQRVNRKKVHRIMKLMGCACPSGEQDAARAGGGLAPVRRAPQSAQSHRLGAVALRQDGWCVSVPIIDCCTREMLGHAGQIVTARKSSPPPVFVPPCVSVCKEAQIPLNIFKQKRHGQRN